MPYTAADYQVARERLCRRLKDSGTLTDAVVEAAMRRVPREAFVPATNPEEVYCDSVIPVTDPEGRWLTTSSQPGMMAIQLQQLRVDPGHSVLEIGAGTGYNAALLTELTGESGSVHSVEVDPAAAGAASTALARAGFRAAVHAADGADGWPPAAPYDRIIATVAVWDLPQPWLDQAVSSARIVAPLTVMGTELSTALTPEHDTWLSRSLSPCGFVRFRGRLAHPDPRGEYGMAGEPVVSLAAEPGQLPPRSAMDEWLADGSGRGTTAPPARDSWEGLVLWALQHHGPLRLARAESRSTALGWSGAGLLLWDERGCAVLTPHGQLFRFGAGTAGDSLARLLDTWHYSGRPGLAAFRLRLTGEIFAAGPGRLPRWAHTLLVEQVTA